jgi:hypothetical protein
VDEGTEHPDLVNGKYLFRLESRTLDDIRELGQNPPEDERRFATVAKVSEVNRSLYRTFAGPVVRTVFQEPVAKLIRRLHPHRLRFSVLSDRNPFMWPVKLLAPAVSANRKPVSPKNPLLSVEKAVSSWVASSLDAAGAMRDAMTEAVFLGVYGLPAVQAAVGLGPEVKDRTHAERDLSRELLREKSRAELETRYVAGGTPEAMARALIYVRLPEGSVDERGFWMIMALRDARPAEERRSLAELKAIVKEQFLLVTLDEERAIDTLPALLPRSVEKRRAALDALRRILIARGSLSEEARSRLQRVERLFDLKSDKAGPEQQLQA